MGTNLKVILTAIGVAVLASPVMAQSALRPHAAPVAGISSAHGSVAGAGRLVPGLFEGSQTRIDDCVHVTFPQCGGEAGGF
jgi:hypothetical protein